MAKLNITELDFENSKQQLKTYLKTQTQFKDYDFDGSNLSVLLDVLSYNTFQNNFYTNMAINEMFLDSAVLRNSVMSHAKELNYLPRSRTSAKAVVNVTVVDTTLTGQTITIPQYAIFTTSYQGENYEFVTNKAYVARKTGAGTFVAENVEIFEGVMLTSFEKEGYFVDNEGILKIILSNENADVDSLAVFVDAEATEEENQFVRKNDIFGVGPTDKVFYVEPYYDGKYSVYFGNNVFGEQPGEVEDIRVQYRVTSGAEANGASKFSINITENGTTTVTTVSNAAGGADQESIDSIRYFAPKALQIQERAVTANDYEILLKQNFPEIQAVAAYSGDELNPPQFGRVAISVYLGQGEENLSATLQNTFIDYLKDKTPLGIEPVFVSPEYIYATIDIEVFYDPKLTTKSAAAIEQIIRNKVQTYNTTNLDNFNTTLRASNLLSQIESADVSFTSATLKAIPFIEYSPPTGIAQSPSFKFETKIRRPYPYDANQGFTNYNPAITSTNYDVDGTCVKLMDDGKGNIMIVSAEVVTPQIINPKIGTVDYDTGVISLTNFRADQYDNAAIFIKADTTRASVFAPKGRLFTVRDTEVNVTITAEGVSAALASTTNLITGGSGGSSY